MTAITTLIPAARADHATSAPAPLTDAVLAGVAHDIRNALAALEAGLDLISRHADEPDKVRQFSSAAREAARRGLELTSSLLESTKPPQDQLRPEDLSAAVRRISMLLQYAAGPDVRLMFDLADGLPPCIIDRAGFTSAMVNLVLNAREAMPAGGMIHVATDLVDPATSRLEHIAGGRFVRLQVCDTGQGMPAQVMERMFAPFFTTKGTKGTGLGLPQLDAFMRRAGGFVRAVSRPGEGSSFELYFRCPAPPPG